MREASSFGARHIRKTPPIRHSHNRVCRLPPDQATTADRKRMPIRSASLESIAFVGDFGTRNLNVYPSRLHLAKARQFALHFRKIAGVRLGLATPTP